MKALAALEAAVTDAQNSLSKAQTELEFFRSQVEPDEYAGMTAFYINKISGLVMRSSEFYQPGSFIPSEALIYFFAPNDLSVPEGWLGNPPLPTKLGAIINITVMGQKYVRVRLGVSSSWCSVTSGSIFGDHVFAKMQFTVISQG